MTPTCKACRLQKFIGARLHPQYQEDCSVLQKMAGSKIAPFLPGSDGDPVGPRRHGQLAPQIPAHLFPNQVKN